VSRTAQGGALPLPELERVLEQACGVALSPGVRQTLADAFRRAAREADAPADAFLGRLLTGEPRAVALLVEHAVVGETYFHRHPEQLEALDRNLLRRPPQGRPLAVWSAGCASGEEPYTLAMLLLEAGRAGAGDRILATDVSARALDTARAGLYGEWSLRRLDPALRARHFRAAGRRLAVTPEVRAPVELRRHNLVTDLPPGGGFDLVLCRNVLIYFSAATAEAVLARLVDALRPGGWLVVGPVEAPLLAGLPLERHEVPGLAVRRVGAPARPTGADRLLALRRDREAGPPAAPAPPQVVRPAAASREPTCHADASAACQAAFDEARRAARAGELAQAEALARAVGEHHLCPESFLLVAMAAEARGDDAAAAEAVRRALYLEPGLAQAHAALVPILGRLGRADDAARARRNALEALEGLADDVELRGIEPITAGALRRALAERAAAPHRSTAPWSLG
jgi:chemotaxis protein methyltransferase CheR